MLDIYNLYLQENALHVKDLYKSIPIALHDEGYDIWLDGNRGTIYQRGHKYPVSQEIYWDFSYSDMGVED